MTNRQTDILLLQPLTRYIISSSGSYEFSLPVPKFLSATLSAAGLGDAVAPMPGVIEKVSHILQTSKRIP